MKYVLVHLIKCLKVILCNDYHQLVQLPSLLARVSDEVMHTKLTVVNAMFSDVSNPVVKMLSMNLETIVMIPDHVIIRTEKLMFDCSFRGVVCMYIIIYNMDNK